MKFNGSNRSGETFRAKALARLVGGRALGWLRPVLFNIRTVRISPYLKRIGYLTETRFSPTLFR